MTEPFTVAEFDQRQETCDLLLESMRQAFIYCDAARLERLAGQLRAEIAGIERRIKEDRRALESQQLQAAIRDTLQARC